MPSPRTGFLYALVAFTIFAAQDGISKHLGSAYPPVFIAMLRYWAFAVFVLLMAARSAGGIRGAVMANRPWLQIGRGVLLAVQIVISIFSFAVVGLAHSHSILASAPLIVAALSMPLLGEHVGWRRWSAIFVGFIGVLVILKPEGDGFDAETFESAWEHTIRFLKEVLD